MVILSLFKSLPPTAESLERHDCLGFCISLKNIPLQSFALWVACLLLPSGENTGTHTQKTLPLHHPGATCAILNPYRVLREAKQIPDVSKKILGG